MSILFSFVVRSFVRFSRSLPLIAPFIHANKKKIREYLCFVYFANEKKICFFFLLLFASGSCYFVGLFDSRARQLVLCPLKAITQLRPQFQYLDPSSTLNKETSVIDDDAGANISDGEQSGSESEENKPELAASLVTMKFNRKESDYHKNKRLQSYNYYRQKVDEDRWQDLMCVMNVQSFEAQRLRERFLTMSSN